MRADILCFFSAPTCGRTPASSASFSLVRFRLLFQSRDKALRGHAGKVHKRRNPTKQNTPGLRLKPFCSCCIGDLFLRNTQDPELIEGLLRFFLGDSVEVCEDAIATSLEAFNTHSQVSLARSLPALKGSVARCSWVRQHTLVFSGARADRESDGQRFTASKPLPTISLFSLKAIPCARA